MLILDDPYEEPATPEEAAKQRENVIKWFDEVFGDRLKNSSGKRIVIIPRIHPDDKLS